MANSLLTPTVILKEAGRLFHQKAKVIQACDRQYDSQFAQTGAKKGYSINLRDRNEYLVTTGATLVVQDTTEAFKTLTVNTQKHIGLNFNSADLTMVIDEFSDRYLKPAVARLVANIEADVVSQAVKATANLIDNDAAAFSFANVASARRRLDESLSDEERYLFLCPQHAEKYLGAVTTITQPVGLQGQYTSGTVKDFNGFMIDSTTQLTPQTTGTAAKVTTYLANSATAQTGSSITVDTGSTTFLAGDVITIAGVNACHPETKADYGYLRQFTITANSGASATTLAISPAIVSTGAKQNVTAAVADNSAITKISAGASETLVQSLAFAKGAFIFGTADLEDMSQYGGWGTRMSMDGVSMRLWRQGDIVNDAAPVRLDVLYGFLARYPGMACRIHADG